MNEILQQLATLGPGIAAGLKGNGAAMQAFLEGYQQTLAQLEEKKRAEQQMATQGEDRALRMEDRQRGIDRQGQADTEHAEERRRRMALEQVQIAPMLAEAGSVSETPQGAEQSIDALFQMLAPTFGGAESLAPVRDRAIGMAGRTITGRQKKQVEAYVAQWENSALAQQNTEADPEMIDLPEHIVRIIGKPAAKYSELKQFAQLPVGRPASKERIPAAAGSMEEFSDPATTPERKAQIEQDRKAYMQADDRPRVDVTVSGQEDATDTAQQLVDGYLVPSMLSRRGNYNAILAEANRIAKSTTGKPYNAARAQTEYAASQRFMSALNGQQQQRFRALAGAVVNTIDEVKALSSNLQNSGIPVLNRLKLLAYAQTHGNSPQGQLVARYIGAVNTLKEEFANLANGGYAPTEAAWGLANQQINGDFGVKQMDAALTEVQRLINFRMQAFETLRPYGVDPENPATAGMGAAATKPAGGAFIVATDPQGNIHHAPAGTPLPAGWKLKP